MLGFWLGWGKPPPSFRMFTRSGKLLSPSGIETGSRRFYKSLCPARPTSPGGRGFGVHLPGAQTPQSHCSEDVCLPEMSVVDTEPTLLVPGSGAPTAEWTPVAFCCPLLPPRCHREPCTSRPLGRRPHSSCAQPCLIREKGFCQSPRVLRPLAGQAGSLASRAQVLTWVVCVRTSVTGTRPLRVPIPPAQRVWGSESACVPWSPVTHVVGKWSVTSE